MFIVGPARFFAQQAATTPGAASQTLLPGLFDESTDTFFTPVVTSRLTLLPNLYTDLDTFFTPVVKGRNTLTPSLYVDADTFFTPKVSHGLHAGFYTDADTFYTPVVSQPGAATQTLLPSIYVDSDTFFTPTVLSRTTLTPSIYTDVDTFFGAVVKGRSTLTPNLLLDPDSFATPQVTQRQTLVPSLYTDVDTFYSEVISVGPNNFFPSLFSSFSFFFTPSMGDGSEEEPEIFGGGKQYRYEKVKSSDIDSVLYEGDNLKIRYTDGKVYNYSDVSEKKFDKLVHSRSPGSYVHKNIKEKHAYYRFK